MKFGSVPLMEAVGATLVHAVHARSVTLKKGEVVGRDHLPLLQAEGFEALIVARLEDGDVGENEAARKLAEALGGAEIRVERAFTGRANLFARCNGVLTVDRATIDRLNAIDEALTVATLPPMRAVAAGEMVATVKIIPFAVADTVLDTALGLLQVSPLHVQSFKPLRVGVLSTVLPGLKPNVIRKTVQHLAARLTPAAAPIVIDEALPHDADALATRLQQVVTLCDIVVIFGASAITDRRDIIPTALLAAGGRIEQFGMPVDPGNLLLLGQIGATAVIGAPGCARSPKENGFDWVLQRLLAGIPVTRDDIRALGIGGLLMEIGTRPQPRLGLPRRNGAASEQKEEAS